VTPAVFAIPGDISLPTGGYMYDRRVLALLPRFDVAACHLELPGSFPDPTQADLAETERILAGVAAGSVLVVDGLAYGALPVDLIERVRAPIVALVHHPLCLEAGLSESRQKQLLDLEKAALALAKHVIVTSAATARTLHADFGVEGEKTTVAEPGTDPAQRARGSAGSLQLLSVGSIVPRKAYDILVRALAPLKDRDWQLTVAGATDRSPEALAAVHAEMRATGLRDRVILAGAVAPERLTDMYASADVFLLPSLYEGYGMVLAEAMARGLPLVCTTGGAAAETAPDAAAIKVPPGDQSALTVAIGRLLDKPELRRRLADASWAAGQQLPRWEDTARTIAGVIEELAR
jgi:glycosyltransferase involved in cell wall biosynthesis